MSHAYKIFSSIGYLVLEKSDSDIKKHTRDDILRTRKNVPSTIMIIEEGTNKLYITKAF